MGGGRYNTEYLSTDSTKAIKGIAAVLIVFHHIAKDIVINGSLIFMRYIGIIMVAIFYFVSGYGLMYNLKNCSNYLDSFLRKRLLNLMIPYWLIFICTIIIDFISNKRFSPMDYIFSFFSFGPVVSVWFVSSILLFYLAFYISFYIERILDFHIRWIEHSYVLPKNFDIGKLILALTMIIYCISCYLLHLPNAYTSSVAAFYLGILWMSIESKFLRYVRTHYFLSLFGSFFLFCSVFMGRLAIAVKLNQNECLHMLLRNVVCVLFILFMIICIQKITVCGKILLWLGSISYELYMVHCILMGYVRKRFSNVFGYSTGVLFISLLIAWCIHWIALFLKKKIL